MKDGLKVHGFTRLELIDVRGPHKGRRQRTKWGKNVITQDGFEKYIVGPIGAIAGSKTVTHLQVATQTDTPVSTQTSASGEFEARKTANITFSSYGTLRATASWDTNEATQSTLGAVAMYNTSSAGTAGSVKTYSTSNKTTDQELRITYEWRFASA